MRDRDANFQWDLHEWSGDTLLPNNGDQQYNFTWILGTDYDPSGTMYGDGAGGTKDFFAGADGAVEDAMWTVWLDERGTSSGMLAEESRFKLTAQLAVSPADTFTFVTPKSGSFLVAGGEANALYIKYTLLNKGSRTLEGFYFTIWSDPDLGGAGDDLVGCDPEDNLFFCYNATNTDAVYGSTPPAVGFKVIEGPLVDAPGDTAYVDGSPIFDKRNLGLSSFTRYIGADDPDSYKEAYGFMNGLNKNGGPVIDPTTGEPTKFMVSGDPVTGTGWNDSDESDRRISGSIGPFTMAPGDTQYVTIKVAVGQGTDRLHSITKLREILNTPPDFHTAVSEESYSLLPRTITLRQNYPNPFNPTTAISFTLPRRSQVSLDVFNILGQKVTTLTNSQLPVGEHTLSWDASDVASGIYFYRLRVGETTLARKMVLLK